MTTLTLAEFTKRLEAANIQKGSAGVAHMKALTLESCPKPRCNSGCGHWKRRWNSY